MSENHQGRVQAAEIMLDEAKVAHVIRRRQKLEDIWANEVALG